MGKNCMRSDFILTINFLAKHLEFRWQRKIAAEEVEQMSRRSSWIQVNRHEQVVWKLEGASSQGDRRVTLQQYFSALLHSTFGSRTMQRTQTSGDTRDCQQLD
uniref:Uncharacterized protein n=1 Tax=Hyaloperonospora arabidopsidis (strain Emoy2) TaxID=559515 RepID=M4C561_HYAAE